jgi:hypothetical protein
LGHCFSLFFEIYLYFVFCFLRFYLFGLGLSGLGFSPGAALSLTPAFFLRGIIFSFLAHCLLIGTANPALRMTENVIIPRVLGIIPCVLEINPRVFEIIPRVFEINPRVLDINPRVFEINPRVFEINPRVLEVNARVLGMIPRVFEIIPRVFKINPRVFEMIPRGIILNF